MIQSTPSHRLPVVAVLALVVVAIISGCGHETDSNGYVVVRDSQDKENLPYQFDILSRHPVRAGDGKPTIGRVVPITTCGNGQLRLYWAVDHWRRPEPLSSVILYADYRFTDAISHLHIPTLGFSDNYEMDFDSDGICDIMVTYRTHDTLWLSGINEERGIFLTLPLATGQDINGSGHWDGRGYILGDYDLDGDGVPELLVAVDTGYDLYPRTLLCVDLVREEVRWRYDVAGIIHKDPMWIGPLTEGGPTEIIISVNSKGNAAVANGMDDLHAYMVALDADGNELHRRVTDQVFGNARFAVVDRDGDGSREVALVQRDTLSGPGDDLVERSYFAVLDTSWKQIDRVEIAPGRVDRIDRLDIDGDGADEIEIPFPDGRIMFLNERLEVVGKLRLPQRGYAWVAEDFLGTGEPQLIGGTGDGGLWLLLSPDFQPLARVKLPEGHMASLARFIPGNRLGEPMMTVAAEGSTVYYTLGLNRSPWWTVFARNPWLGPIIVFVPMGLVALLIAWLWIRARRQARTIAQQRDRLGATIDQLRQAQARLVAAEELEVAQEALKASEQRFRELADMLPQPVYEMNLQGLITYANEAGIKVFDVNPSMLKKGIHWTRFIAESEHDLMQQRINDIIQQGIEYHREWKAVLPDGSELPVLIYSNPIYRDGSVVGIRGIVVDISDIKESQRALVESEEKYRALVESASEAIFMVDYTGRYLFMNTIAAQRLGGSQDEFVGRTIQEVFPQEYSDRHLKSIRSVFDVGEGAMFESTTMLQGKEHHYRTSLQPVRDADGRIFAVTGIGRDITALVVARRELQSERDFIRRLLDTANGLIICLDERFRITVFNDEAERVTGYSRDEVLGMDWRKLFMPDEHLSHEIDDFRSWVQEHPRDSYEGPLKTKAGEIRTILWSNSSLIDEATGELTAIAVGQDITDRIEAEEALRQSEQEYRLVVENVRAAIAVVDAEGRFLFVNGIGAAVHNLAPQDMIGRTQWEVFPGPIADRQVENVRQVIRTGEPLSEEAEVYEPERGTCWYHTTLQPYRNASGVITAALVVAHDITEAKQAAAALRESEERYQTLVEASRDAIIVADIADRRHIFANSAASRIFGIPHDEIMNTGVHDPTSPAGQKRAIEVFETILEGRTEPIYDVPAKARDGRQIYLDISGVRATFEGRDVLIGFFRDVTDRYEATRALRESEERFRSIAEATPSPLVMSRLRDGVIIYANRALGPALGYDPDEMVGMQASNLYASDEERRRVLEALERDGEARNLEVAGRRKDGSEMYALLSGRIIEFEGEQVVFGSFNDITDRRKAEQALKESEERFRRIAEATPVAVAIADLSEYSINYANSHCDRLFGYEPGGMIGLPTTNLYYDPEERRDMLAAVLEGGMVSNREIRLRRQDGSPFWALLTIRRTSFEGKPSVIASFIDITEHRRSERELRKAAQERYELSKRIAGSVAHEIYNALFPVSTSVTKLDERIELNEPGEIERNRKLLDLAKRAVKRAIDATGLVKEYSRLESERSDEPVDLKEVIDETLEINSQRIADSSVQVSVSVSDEAGPGMSRRHAFSLFNNLLINALDALEEVDRQRQIDIKAQVEDGRWRIEFTDNGPGIPESQREQVFKPFYTTKRTRGTGLGLAMIQQIVELYGGTIELESSVDRFTRFLILLYVAGTGGGARNRTT